MRILGWRTTLPLLQLAVALAALVYAPYELRARYHVAGDDFMLLGYRQAWPPPILRTSYALNFPALTAVVPFRFWGNWSSREVVRYQGPLFFSFSVEDCMFLGGVSVLWYLIGRVLDRRKQTPETAPSPKSGAVPLAIGFLFAVGVDALASFYAMLTDADRPMRQIGFFGLAWAVSLLWYFGNNLIRALRPC